MLQIGTVFASEEFVCPNAVGVDIGEYLHEQLSESVTVKIFHAMPHMANQVLVTILAEVSCGCGSGCGMCAVPMSGLFKDQLNKRSLVEIQNLIKDYVPTGLLLRCHLASKL